MTLVSVIIPTRDRADLLRDAIESVLAVNRRAFGIEVIVVDDGSSDHTASLVHKYPVVYLQTARVGPSGARNAGILAARGDFIAFLDDDDVWLPHNVTPQLEMFAANPSFGAVHAQVRLTGPDRTPWDMVMPGGDLPSGWVFDDVLTHKTQLASVLIRRSVFQEVGLFDVTLRAGEDWDLLLRIAKRYQTGRVQDQVALFRQRCDNNELYDYQSMPDAIAVFRRHTRAESLRRRLALRPILWRHRGWYAATFIGYARAHASIGNHKRAMRSLRYALVASPAHALVRHPDFWHTVARIAIRFGHSLHGL